MRRLLFFILVFAVLLWIANTTALKYDLYFITSWFDAISHTIGGVVVSGAIVYFLQSWRFPKEILVLVFVLFIGLIWEVFELNMGLTDTGAPWYFLDSVSDLLFDLLGAHIAYSFAKKNHV